METWFLPEGAMIVPSDPISWLLSEEPQPPGFGFAAITWSGPTSHDQLQASARLEALVARYHTHIFLPSFYPFIQTAQPYPTLTRTLSAP
jgi:hypothetical protein